MRPMKIDTHHQPQSDKPECRIRKKKNDSTHVVYVFFFLPALSLCRPRPTAKLCTPINWRCNLVCDWIEGKKKADDDEDVKAYTTSFGCCRHAFLTIFHDRTLSLRSINNVVISSVAHYVHTLYEYAVVFFWPLVILYSNKHRGTTTKKKKSCIKSLTEAFALYKTHSRTFHCTCWPKHGSCHTKFVKLACNVRFFLLLSGNLSIIRWFLAKTKRQQTMTSRMCAIRERVAEGTVKYIYASNSHSLI